MPSSMRPPAMTSMVAIILATSAGLRYPLQTTTWPSRTRVVIAARAASAVKDSKVSSSVGFGTVWKWSKSQIDSKPSRSASFATATVRVQAAAGSHPSYSPVHPCGTMTPTFTWVPPRVGDRGAPGGHRRPLQSRPRGPSGASSPPHNHLVPCRTDRHVADPNPGQRLEALDVRPRTRRELAPRARRRGIGLPTFELFVHGLEARIDRCRSRHRLPPPIGLGVTVRDADADALEAIEHVELGQGDRRVPGQPDAEAQRDRVVPPAASSTDRGGPVRGAS